EAVAQTIDGPKVHWNVSLYGKSRGSTLGFETLRDELAARTNGNFVFQLHYGETLAPAKENLDGLKIGAFEAAWGVTPYAPGKQPAVSALELPFLPMETLAAVAKVHERYYRLPEVTKEFATWNSTYLAAVVLPHYEFMGRGKVPDQLDDWKNRRLRAPGGAGKVMEKIGAVPTSMPAPDIYNALERGLIEAVALDYYAFISYRINELSTWYTKGFGLYSPATQVLAATGSFDALPPQYKQLLAELGPRSTDKMVQELNRIDDEAEAEFKKRGMKMVTLTPQVRQQILQDTQQTVWSDWVKEVTPRGVPGQKLLDFILAEAVRSNT
ncbi:MAG: TRAP transporter substrate-binding protein DctP, partial [Alphaproteobacteria bacterium]